MDSSGLESEDVCHKMDSSGLESEDVCHKMDSSGLESEDVCHKMDSSGLGSEGQTHVDADEKVPKPFMCGLCQDVYSELDVYLIHMKSHSEVSDKSFHTCSSSGVSDKSFHTCSSSDVSDKSFHTCSSSQLRQTEKDIPIYQCRICCGHFTSICLLHNHIADSTTDGSYIFDHSKNTAYPLSMHCAGYESRQCTLEDSKDCEDSVANVAFKPEATDDRTIEQVNQFLNNFCLLKNIPGESEPTARVSKRGRKPKVLLNQKEINHVSKTKDKPKTIIEKPYSKKKVKLIQNEVQNTDMKTSKRKGNNFKKSSTPRSDQKFENGLDNVNNNSSGINQDNISAPIINSNADSAEISEARIKLPNADTTDTVDVADDSTHVNHDVDDGSDTDTTEINDVTDQNDMLTDTHATQTLYDKTAYDVSEINSMDLVSIRKQFSVELPDSECKVRKNSVKVECPHCCKIMLPANLKKHLVCHSQDRPYKCDECPKTYKRLVHLRVHKNTHQEVKPYYCEFCGKGVLTATMLKQHVMFHHSESRPFRCDICDASFITNFKLQRHMNKHAGIKYFQCDLCGMGFATRYNLSVHVRGVHKKDLRFSCDQCDKSFMTNYQLKVHLMKHSGERPYKCTVCKADYVERKELRRHLKKQHNLLMEDGYSEHMSHTDAPTVAEMYREDTDSYRTDNKPEINIPSTDVILASSDSFITFPSIEMNQGTMFCIKNEQNDTKLSPSKQLPPHSAEVHDYTTSESMIPGVPLTVSSVNSSFMTVISEREVEQEEDKMNYEHS